MPTFGSLFAGIGGIDLGLERAGWECRWQVEWDGFCQRVLAKHWPDVPRYGDITTVDWSGVERVDLIAGGFPCQPVSFAGQRKGKSDERWLWPAFAAAIRALRPRYVLVENVPGLLAGHGGMGSVLGDLAELGYDAEWDSIPAAAVGAPHLRYRVWIVAYAHGERLEGIGLDRLFVARPSLGHDAERDEPRRVRREQPYRMESERQGAPELGHDGSNWALAYTDGAGLEGRELQPERPDQRTAGPGGVGDTDRPSSDAYTAGCPPRRATGQPSWWSPEPDVGRVAHGVPARVDRLRALGNAVVPQVVEVIGRRLLEVMP